MKQKLLSALVLLSLLVTLIGTVQAQPQPAGPALLYVPLASEQDLDGFEATGLPAYARLQGQEGPYLLAGADALGQAALAEAGLPFRVLDPDSSGRAYYLAYLMPGQPLPAWEHYGQILLDDGYQVLLQMSAENARRLLDEAGVKGRRLTLQPKPLRPAVEPKAFPAVITPDPIIQSMIDQVTTSTVYQYDGDLSGEWPVVIGDSPYTIVTRHTYSGTPIQKATQFAYEHLQALGLDMEYHYWGGSSYPNVIGELPSYTGSDEIYIICAHIDDMPSGPIAPGADDNASGVVAVLLAADLLTQYNWEGTLRFALWTGEEQWLLGSEAYAERAYNNGDNIQGVLNLDMIAWNSDSNPAIDLHADQVGVPPSMQLAQLFSDVIDAYDLDLVPEIVPDGTGASDHASFWDYGYSAILGIEDFADFNLYYHTVNDLLVHLDIDYFTAFVQASIATFAHMGGLLLDGPGFIDGYVTNASSGAAIAGAQVTMQRPAEPVRLTHTDASGYYSQSLPIGSYTVTASSYGYFEQSVPDVPVYSNTVTTQNLSLTARPFYVVSGTVRDAASSAPLAAQIRFLGSPLTVTTDPASGYYSASLAQGSYVAQVSAFGYEPLEQELLVEQDQSQHFWLNARPCVLLVDDDQDYNGYDMTPFYSETLEALGCDYARWEIDSQGSPTPEDLFGHPLVLWFTGFPWNGTLNPDDKTALAAYLDDGGHLVLSSQEYLKEHDADDFGQNYLGVYEYMWEAFDTDPVGRDGDPIGDGLGPYALTLPPGWDVFYTDDLRAVQAAPFRWASGGASYNSTRYEGATFQSVFFAWPLEGLAELEDRQEVLGAVLNWLDVCLPPCEPVNSLDFSWEPWTPTAGYPVTFTAQASGTAPIDCVWDFGDGSPPLTADIGVSVGHSYAAPGPYQVTLTATNCSTATALARQTVTVACEPITNLQPQHTPATPAPGQIVTLTARSSGTAPISFTWRLGDGSPVRVGRTITHSYALPGDYALVLTATNCAGPAAITGTIAVTWGCVPVQQAYLARQPLTPTVGQSVHLSAWVGGLWLEQTVDSELGPPGALGYNSLALDALGHPHIAYYEHITRSGDLKYAHYDGQAWQRETVDAAGDVGSYCSLALDAAGRPHVSYADESGAGGLNYAWHDGSEWLTQTVQAGQFAYHTSLDINWANLPTISYLRYDWGALDGDLNYAHFSGSSWIVETVDDSGSAGWYSSVATDDMGHPHISYLGDGLGLRYAHFDGLTWTTETVSAGEGGEYSALALDAAGRPHVSSIHDGRLQYTRHDGQAWQIETAEGLGRAAGYSALVLNAQDQPHVSYYERDGGGLRYAWRDGADWRYETVAAPLGAGASMLYNDLALDAAGRPHLSYYDPAEHSLAYAWRAADSTPPITYTWDLGDGTLAEGEVITHSYLLPGAYTVTLTASNPCGQAVLQQRLQVVQRWNWYLPVVFKGSSVVGTNDKGGWTQ